jgi:hypothetical protein
MTCEQFDSKAFDRLCVRDDGLIFGKGSMLGHFGKDFTQGV